MKILIYAPNYYPATRYGGPIRSSHGLASALVKLGHEVHVFTTNVDGPDTLDVPLGDFVNIDDVKVHYFATSTPQRIYYSPTMGRALETRVAEFDVVHINGTFLWPGPRAARIARRASVPHIVSPRGMLVPEMIAGKSRLAKHAWIATQERQNLRWARAIHVTSDEEACGIGQLGFNLPPIVTIGNGVDRPQVRPSDQDIEKIWSSIPSGSRVAFLGRLDWTKGADLAIEAVTEHSHAEIILAGPDQIGLRETLEPKLAMSSRKICGRFIGALDETRKWALLEGADVLLVPSIKESFGLAAAEALAIGTPVICTQGVGASAIVRRIDADCVVPRTADALAQALTALLADRGRRTRFRDKSQSIMATEYTWPTIARQMECLYADGIPAET